MRKKVQNSKKMYEEQGYNQNQIDCLMEGIAKGQDVSLCENPEFDSFQMNQILRGLSAGVDATIYAKTDYNWFQMEEIRKGLERKLDISSYLDANMDFRVMREVRKGLEVGLDMNPYAELGAPRMRQIRKALLENIDIMPDIEAGYDAEQLDEIRCALEKGIDVRQYITPEFRAKSIQEISLGMEEGIDVSVYANIVYSWRQMREIRLGLEHRMDITKYTHRLYSDGQMREIRLGLENGIDVERFKSFMYTANEMKEIRLRLEKSEEKKNDTQSMENLGGFKNAKKLNDLEVEISEDRMEAFLDLSYKTTSWDRVSVLKTLYLKGIRKGVLLSVVDGIIDGSVSGRKVLIARGSMPVDGEDGYYEYFFRTEYADHHKKFVEDPIDYQKTPWFETVTKGQKLACYHMATDGTPGYDVSGMIVPANKGTELPILKGRGFLTDKNQCVYYAACNGKVTYSENGLWIYEIHTIDSVVSVHGEVFFDGMIIVKGYVGTGASIVATDDILVEGYVEGARLKSNGNILIRQGVNAKDSGVIEAKRSVLGKFFEDATIRAGEYVHADYCMNCDIVTEGKVILVGEKGSLIGGYLRAQEGVYVLNAGNRASKQTFISIGISDELYEEQQRIADDISKVKLDLERLETVQQELIEKYPPEMRNTMEVFLKIGSAVFTKKQQLQGMNEKYAAVKHRMTQIRFSGVRVVNELFENVIVNIDGKRWVSQYDRNVTLKCLNKKISIYRN